MDFRSSFVKSSLGAFGWFLASYSGSPRNSKRFFWMTFSRLRCWKSGCSENWCLNIWKRITVVELALSKYFFRHLYSPLVLRTVLCFGLKSLLAHLIHFPRMMKKHGKKHAIFKSGKSPSLSPVFDLIIYAFSFPMCLHIHFRGLFRVRLLQNEIYYLSHCPPCLLQFPWSTKRSGHALKTKKEIWVE